MSDSQTSNTSAPAIQVGESPTIPGISKIEPPAVPGTQASKPPTIPEIQSGQSHVMPGPQLSMPPANRVFPPGLIPPMLGLQPDRPFSMPGNRPGQYPATTGSQASMRPPQPSAFGAMAPYPPQIAGSVNRPVYNPSWQDFFIFRVKERTADQGTPVAGSQGSLQVQAGEVLLLLHVDAPSNGKMYMMRRAIQEMNLVGWLEGTVLADRLEAMPSPWRIPSRFVRYPDQLAKDACAGLKVGDHSVSQFARAHVASLLLHVVKQAPGVSKPWTLVRPLHKNPDAENKVPVITCDGNEERVLLDSVMLRGQAFAISLRKGVPITAPITAPGTAPRPQIRASNKSCGGC